MGTLHEEQYTFLIISSNFFLEREMFLIKDVEKFKTHILCSVTFSFFFPKIVLFMK